MSLRSNSTSRRYVTALCVLFVVVSLVAGPMTALAAQPSSSPVGPESGTLEKLPFTDADASDGPTIDPSLENVTGEVAVIVQFEDPETPMNRSAESIAERQNAANVSQASLERYAEQTDGVTLEERFWVTNAALVTIDVDRNSIEEIAEIDGVVGIEPESDLTLETDTTTDAASLASTGASYGHEQTNVEDVWNGFHTKGEGTTIVVLDSGVETDHPDIDLEKWKDFTSNGSDKPVAYDEHGTLVSAVATGGDDSGSYIGVAPDASLMHGAVVSDCSDGVCSTSESAVLGGIEWAVENDADAVSISLGWYDYSDAFIDSVGNAHDAGTVVVAASGNDGEDSSLTPANVYDALSVGAVDRSEDLASFSSTARIDTADAWGASAPNHWPDEYTVPDVVAPGVGIKSATADGDYRTTSGTSIATPHAAGTVALIQSATAADHEAEELADAIRETARYPDDKSDDSDLEQGYGHGIVDAYAALETLGGYSTVEGTVTDAITGDQISNATVTLAGEDTELETTTGDDGAYEFSGLEGEREYVLEIERDGYDTADRSYHVLEDEAVTADVELAGDASIELALVDEQFGDGIESATVEAVGDPGTYPATHEGDGTYVVSNVPSHGEFTLEGVAAGYENDDVTVAVDSPGTVSESLALTGDATLEIDVENDDGEPVADASVTVVRESGASYELSPTAENGTVTATVAGTGESYTVEASESEAGSGSAETSAVESATTVGVTVTVTESLLPTPGFGVPVAIVAVLIALGVRVRRPNSRY